MGVARTLVVAIVAFAAGFAVRPVAKAGAPRTTLPEPSSEAWPRVEASSAAPPPKTAANGPTVRPVPARQLVGSLARAAADENDPEDTLQAMARLAKLDASMTAEFVERWRVEQDPRLREAAMTLVLVCGGPDAIAFVRERLAGARDERASMLVALAGGSQGVPISPRRLPVDDALAATAASMAESRDLTERLAAATLLASNDSDRSRDVLRRLAEADAETDVRAAAVRALGHVGDRATLAWLETRPADAAVRVATAALRRRLGL